MLSRLRRPCSTARTVATLKPDSHASRSCVQRRRSRARASRRPLWSALLAIRPRPPGARYHRRPVTASISCPTDCRTRADRRCLLSSAWHDHAPQERSPLKEQRPAQNTGRCAATSNSRRCPPPCPARGYTPRTSFMSGRWRPWQTPSNCWSPRSSLTQSEPQQSTPATDKGPPASPPRHRQPIRQPASQASD
jgi:hypothetical protein